MFLTLQITSVYMRGSNVLMYYINRKRQEQVSLDVTGVENEMKLRTWVGLSCINRKWCEQVDFNDAG